MLIAANIFQPLIDVFEAVLTFFHNSLGVPWGWAIVLLTVVIRALLVPLTLKQFHSMQRLQRLQPELKAIQAKYKDDKQRQQQELMKFYKENQVNPLGSCLPLVAQIPVFISLFYMLRQSLRADICPQVQPGAHLVDGKWVGISHAHTVPCGPHNGAEFLFIPDLTNKATGAVLVTLIVLYVGTQLASSMLMSSPTMDRTQRRIMMLLPVFFVIFIINFPAGVIVYWVTTNAWTILQQYVIKKRIGPMAPAPATAAVAAGSGNGRDGGGRDGRESAPAASTGGGLGGLLRGRVKTEEPAPVAAGSRSRAGRPPPPPRKKKKRSGRRR
ncbi:MAG: membrane protein insertase YidC [Solirubrobacterales bacterium]|nr:membrane protein insertase YidC [Solirubrobacterales bacterium]